MPPFRLFAGVAALLAGFAPLPLSIASVFLFAGPHNWMEARYFLARLPNRCLIHRGFFATALAGVASLGLTFALTNPGPFWFTALGLWILVLIHLAGRDPSAASGPVLLAIALAWWDLPTAGLLLLFLHPVAALLFLFRQARHRWPDRSRTADVTFLALFGLAIVIIRWHSTGPAGPFATLSSQGLTAMPNHPALVALHAYLELLHYGAWMIALPLMSLTVRPWNWSDIPLARRWPVPVKSVLGAGGAAVVILWLAFTLDYDSTRTVYFSIAIFHVLAEAPMLIWMR